MCCLIAISPLTDTFLAFAFFHLKNISKLRPMLSMSNAEMLIHAFMTSRSDYCNALLGGCAARLINKLQMVQNAAARVLTRTRKYEHISPVLSTLHRLPTKHRIDFKILIITYKALNGLAPQYLSELLSHYAFCVWGFISKMALCWRRGDVTVPNCWIKSLFLFYFHTKSILVAS